MAKKADEVGNTHQLDRWRQGLKTAGLQLSISRSGQQVDRHTAEVRLDILFERLERPDGVARDIQEACRPRAPRAGDH